MIIGELDRVTYFNDRYCLSTPTYRKTKFWATPITFGSLVQSGFDFYGEDTGYLLIDAINTFRSDSPISVYRAKVGTRHWELYNLPSARSLAYLFEKLSGDIDEAIELAAKLNLFKLLADWARSYPLQGRVMLDGRIV